MPNFSILLAPAEVQMTGGNPFAPDMFDYRTSNTFNYFHDLNPERRGLIDQLHKLLQDEKTDLEALLGVSGADLEEAVATNLEIYKAPLMSALDRYSPGVMYQAMDFSGLPTGAQLRLLEEGIILSGLFGILRPDDLIPRYHLGMLADVPGIGKITEFWKPQISPHLNETIRDRFVWNLLPESLDGAWDDEMTYAEMVRVQFVRKKKGEVTPVAKGIPPLRGRLVNFIVRETLEDLELLLDWRHPDGYKYDAALSTYDEETRTHAIVMSKRG